LEGSEQAQGTAGGRGAALRHARRSAALRAALGAAVLVAIVAAAWANALDAGFVYDDLVNITQRTSLRWTRLGAAPLVEAVADSPSKRPVALATFGLQYYLGFDQARDFHAVNIAIHAFTGLLVWALVALLFARARALEGQAGRVPGARAASAGAFLAAAVFVAHPLQTQSVTYVVQRMNSLSAALHIATLLLYVLGRRARSPGVRVALWCGAFATWGLALGSKETALAAPLLLWLYEWYFERDLDRAFLRRSAVLALGVGAPTAVAAAVVLAMSGYDPLATYPPKDFGPVERLMTEARVLWFYASQIVWPLPRRLSLLHEFEVSRSLRVPWTTLPAIVGVAAALGATALAARRHRVLSFAAAWFFLHLALESTVLPLALAMEHRLYLPMLGPAMALGWWAAARFEARPVLGVALASSLVLALGYATHVRNEVWRTPETLWRDVLAKYPQQFTALLNLGFDLSGQGRDAEALEVYERALAIAPDDARLHHNMATALAAQGRLDEAVGHFEQSLRLDPDNVLARDGLGAALVRLGRVAEAAPIFGEAAKRFGRPDSWISYGRTQLLLGAPREARRSFERAAQAAPGFAEAQRWLGVTAVELGQLDRAIGHFERAAARAPDDAETHMHAGLAYWQRAHAGDHERAIRHLEAARRLRPDWAVVANNLAWMRATTAVDALRDGEGALALMNETLASAGQRDPDLLGTAAAALAATGRFGQAQRLCEQALGLQHGDAARTLREQAAAYAQRRLWLQAEASP